MKTAYSARKNLYEVTGVFGKSICAKEENGQPSANQGLSIARYSSVKTAAMCIALLPKPAHLPLPTSPFPPPPSHLPLPIYSASAESIGLGQLIACGQCWMILTRVNSGLSNSSHLHILSNNSLPFVLYHSITRSSYFIATPFLFYMAWVQRYTTACYYEGMKLVLFFLGEQCIFHCFSTPCR